MEKKNKNTKTKAVENVLNLHFSSGKCLFIQDKNFLLQTINSYKTGRLLSTKIDEKFYAISFVSPIRLSGVLERAGREREI